MSFEKPEINQEKNVLSIEEFKKSHEKIFQAKEIMGKDFLGRREVETALGIKIDPEKIPEIPFSKEDLERAHELNQFLILRVDKTADGKKLTIENINKLLKGKLKDNIKALYCSDLNGNIRNSVWLKEETFISEETPQPAWAFTSKELIPGSKDKNCIEQIQSLADYLKDEIFKKKTIPSEYQEAIQEFDEKKEDLRRLLKTNWQNVVKNLEKLKISKILRPSSVETVYDLCIYFQNKGEKNLGDTANNTCTSTMTDSEKYFVKIGSFGQYGMDISYLSPEIENSSIGTIFSRTI